MKKNLSGTTIGSYNVKEIIGEGSLGEVYRALDQNGDLVAIKVILQKNLKQDKEPNYLLKQLNTMKLINSPNIVRIYDYIYQNQTHYIIMEYCDGGNFRDKLNHQFFYENIALDIFKQILNGVKGFHEIGIIEIDLQLENIFLHQNQQVKIGNLGFMKHLRSIDQKYIMTPETVKQEPHRQETDIFILGVLLFELLYKRKPFIQTNNREFLLGVKQNNINFTGYQKVSQDTVDLLKSMLKEDPNKRIPFIDIFNHNLFRQTDIQQQLNQGINGISIQSKQLNIQTTSSIYQQNYIDLTEHSQDLQKQYNIQVGLQQQQQDVASGNNQYTTPGLNSYTTPNSDSKLIKNVLPTLSLQDERKINELTSQYYDRFNQLQYVLNTLAEFYSLEFPNVFKAIFPQLILLKKARVEFKKFQSQLFEKINIFESPVFEKTIERQRLNIITQLVKQQVQTLEELFYAAYKPQVDDNQQKMKEFLQNNWLKDNQLEPSEYFNQTYIEVLQYFLTTFTQMENSKQRAKLEFHLQQCLNFDQLLQKKVELSVEFNLK